MKLSHIAFGTLLAVVPSTMLVAQTAKQDMQSAGAHTSAAASSAGKGISKGTKKTYRATKHTSKRAYTKTKSKVDGSPNR